MSDLISREALLQEFNQCAIEFLKDGTFQLQFAAGVICEAMEMIKDAPTVGAVEVVHGHWIWGEVLLNRQTCSCCKARFDCLEIDNFCPNCGAKMEECYEVGKSYENADGIVEGDICLKV